MKTRITSAALSPLMIIVCITVVLGLGSAAIGSPYFLLESESEWTDAKAEGHILPMQSSDWSEYMVQWNTHLEEGVPYPENTFMPPELYVYPGGDLGYPEDGGLVMVWGEQPLAPGSYSSAWKYDYQLDPDLSNVTLTLTVTAPQFDMLGNQINAVSFGIQDVAGNIRAWYWNVGVGQPIPWNVPTTISINTALVGLGAATPAATGFANNPVCNLVNAQFLIVDENAAWVGGPMPAPPPGGQLPGLWNYWHNITVTPNPPAKWSDPTKWSQPPVEWQPGLEPPVYLGWDEYSMYNQVPPQQIVADDWHCTTDDPVTDIHWWGSFIGWDQPEPPQLPSGFHIAIWTDVPAGVDSEYSHPGTLVWENFCDTYEYNFAGYDHDPRIDDPEMFREACFQFNQRLNPEEWFYQDPGPEGNIYWLSIAAIYDEDPTYPWGWKTRPHIFNDDAVRIQLVTDPTGLVGWPPHVGWMWSQGQPIEFPEETSWDLAFELTTIEEEVIDWGDAPDPAYPTLAANNGASHIIVPRMQLGVQIDGEPDGQPQPNALGDDINNIDDEDGVVFMSALVPGQNATVDVTASSAGMLDAWIDFGGDGSWAEAGDQIFFSVPLNPGINNLSFPVPPTAAVGITTFARFRFSTAGGLTYTGQAPDGEVEDYKVFIGEQGGDLDFGDAPDPTYPTLAANNGANHTIVPGMFMGALIDGEPDGQPDPNALGDDFSNIGDEDGVISPTPLVQGQPATVTIVVSAPGMLDAWVDYGADGSWAEAGDQVFASQPLASGANTLNYVVPPTAVPGNTFARLRFSSQGGLSFFGSAPDGEVEDYPVTIEEQPADIDWGDAPDPTYPTLAANNGASHVIVPGFMMGNSIDAEQDGQPDPNALGDDNNGADDEDGVTFVTPFIQGKYGVAKVNVSANGFLDVWLDGNADGDWIDPQEQIVNSAAVTAGDNWVYIGSPAAGVTTFLRFRFSSTGGLQPTGPATDGEVEDYEIRAEPETPAKWASPPDLSPLGMDVYMEEPRILADDFLCTKSGPITKIRVYGSMYHDLYPPEMPEIVLSIHEDIPDPDGQGPLYSMPGRPLWSCQFLPWPTSPDPPYYLDYLHAWDLQEGWYDPKFQYYDPLGDTRCYVFEFTIPYEMAFVQQGTEDAPKIYWLDVQARDRSGEPNTYQFGWKTSATHWNDDAVWTEGAEPYNGMWQELRYPEGHQMAGDSIDLAFEIYTEDLDLGDAPDPNYPTLLASGGASHDVVPGICLGAGLDRDLDGQPDPNALGDDNDSDGDDEDGVTFPTPLVPGAPGYINVVASVPGWLCGWIDFNNDGDWNDFAEGLATWPVTAGPNTIPVWTPPSALGGRNTTARFRFGVIDSPGLPTGHLRDGEVEDYQVYIYPTPIVVNKGGAKLLPLGSYVLIERNTVTANFGQNGWYFEEPTTPTAFGLSAGLGVIPPADPISNWQIDDYVSCYGTTTLNGCELMLQEIYSWQETGTGVVKALGQNNRSSGGGQFGNQPGLLNNPGTGEASYGLNTVALLVKLWGRCTYIETDLANPSDQLNFWIDDGSALWDGTVDLAGNNVLGVKVRVPQSLATPIDDGKYYAVVGIMRTEGSPPALGTRRLWPRDENDIQLISEP